MIAIVAVVALLAGAGVGYTMAPTKEGETETITVEVEPLAGQTIKIGYIVSSTTALETGTPLVQEIMVPDYNAYASKMGYDVDFEYLIDDATGQAAVHLEKVQGFKAIDVSVFIGGGWSSQAAGAMSYVNDNDMLMWSSSSTSPLLGAVDNLFRMCPDDKIQAPAISRMLESQGVQYIVVIQRADAWADGIMNYFRPAFEAGGGVILEVMRYQGESTEFSSYLQTAENIMEDAVAQYGADKCGVEIISFSESVTMVTQAKDYPTIYSLRWYGSDGTTLTQQHIDDAPTQSSHLYIFSTYAAPADTKKFNDLYERYYGLLSQPFGYYSACAYDIGWILTSTMLEAQSTDAVDIIPQQAIASYNSFGASGWNQLNEFGDRNGGDYQIWGYGDIGSGVQNVVYGYYNYLEDVVYWNVELLGYTPTPR
jgi:branched-chain amino acid transport system substrate-binding protein